jgi:hypothetical protein
MFLVLAIEFQSLVNGFGLDCQALIFVSIPFECTDFTSPFISNLGFKGQCKEILQRVNLMDYIAFTKIYNLYEKTKLFFNNLSQQFDFGMIHKDQDIPEA